MKEFFKNSLPYFRKYLPVHVLATLLGLFRVVILLITPQVVALLVDHVVVPLLGGTPEPTDSIFYFLIQNIPPDDYVQIFTVLACLLLSFAAAFFVCFYLKWNLSHYFALKSEQKMRSDALEKVGKASAPLLAKYSSGDLVLITTTDSSRIRSMYTEVSQSMVDSAFYVVVAAILLFKLHYSLLFLPLLGGLGCLINVIRFRKPVRKYFDDAWDSTAALTTVVEESVHGVRTVASFAKEDLRRGIFDQKNRQLLDVNYGGVHMFAKRNLYTASIRSVIFIGEVALAIYLGLKGLITPGESTAILGYLSSFMWQVMNFLYIFNSAQRHLVSSRRFFGFLNDRDEIAEKYGKDIPSRTPQITFVNVGVKNGEHDALRQVDLEIPYGKKVGIMGRTGSGKTLLIKLMQGLAECDEGEIYIDGKPIHSYDRNELLRSYSYAMQNVFLFSNTIAANIALYDPFASNEQIERAGALAEVDEFARRFPDGYQTTIGEKGFGLSGGQKQRISIARALFKNASVLIFDDVTSALDLETERSVFQNIERECGERTLIIVTHRATALKNCDEILFLEEGRIAERGTFEELMNINGNFAEIYHRQIREISA